MNKHYRKSILYLNEEFWIKKGVSCKFDNTVSSFDGAKLSDLLGAYCYTISIVLLTPTTMFFTRMMD